MKPYEIRFSDEVKFIGIPAFDSLKGVCHGFSTRVGGVSSGAFKGMNLALDVGEDNDLVEINRCLFIKGVTSENPEIYTVRQVHGTEVFRIEERRASAEEIRRIPADAIVTDQKGIAIGVLTADCVPVLLVDPVKQVVAAVHAGREGTLQHILTRVIQRMRDDFGTSPGDLHAAVGPCIEAGCYEVGEEIARRISRLTPHTEEVLVQKQGSWFFDLRRANHRELLETGLQEDRIYHVRMCTACQSRTFYSYRRSMGKETGRMMGLIMLREDG